jgi:hypothetical protein
MASTIKLKNSTTAGNTPTSLETGEVAINVADGNLFYGSASAVLQNFIVDELQVKGNLTAQQYIVSSSVTYTTQSFSSGSTVFGDTQDDTHLFTGSISVTGSVTATSFIGDGSGLTGISSAADGTISSSAQFTSTDDVEFRNITASGNISASGRIDGSEFRVNHKAFANTSGDTLRLGWQSDLPIEIGKLNNPIKLVGQVTASIISASGTITANSLVGSHTLTTAAQPNVTSLGTLTSLTVDNLNLNGTTLSSTDDSDVNISLGTSGITFEANTGDKFIFNSDLDNVDLHYSSENDTNIFYIDASEDKVGIGTATPGAKLDVAGDINTTSHITASGNISASGTIVGSNLSGTNTGDQNISNLAITGSDVLFSHITSSGNISSSGTIVANKIESDQLVSHAGDANTGLQFASDTVIIEGNNINIAKFASSFIELNKKTDILLEQSSTTDGDGNGDIVKFGSVSGGGSLDTGKIYYLNSSGQWAKADADSTTDSTGLLGVALGTSVSTNGLLIKGMVTLDHDPGSVGDQIFLKESGGSSSDEGKATSTAPSSTNNVVRHIGYCLNGSSGGIYFDPSPDYIVHA